jgi:hypothetical protein
MEIREEKKLPCSEGRPVWQLLSRCSQTTLIVTLELNSPIFDCEFFLPCEVYFVLNPGYARKSRRTIRLVLLSEVTLIARRSEATY